MSSPEPLDGAGQAGRDVDPRSIAQVGKGRGDVGSAVADISGTRGGESGICLYAKRLLEGFQNFQQRRFLTSSDVVGPARNDLRWCRGSLEDGPRDVVDVSEVTRLEPITMHHRGLAVGQGSHEKRDHPCVRVVGALARAEDVEKPQDYGLYRVELGENPRVPVSGGLGHRIGAPRRERSAFDRGARSEPAIDGRRGNSHHPGDTLVDSGVQDGEGSRRVHPVGGDGILDAAQDGTDGGEVKDDVGTPEGSSHDVAVGDLSDYERHAVRHIGAGSSGQVVENRDVVTLAQAPFDQVASDEARPSGDDHPHGASLSGMGARVSGPVQPLAMRDSVPGKPRLLALMAVALLPARLKPVLYRTLFRYRIGRRVKIGLTILDARSCEIGDDVTIGHGNLVIGVGRLTVGDHARIGHLNLIRGGREVHIGPYVDILRRNEINSIPDPVTVNPVDPCLILGPGAVVTAGHKIDFTDRVEVGRRVIIGGRNSSIWTHNRQRTRPVRIGEMTYLGSESRLAPGAELPARCIVGMGTVVVHALQGEHQLIAGVPGRPVKALDEDDRFLVERKTREDLPEDL